MAHHPDPYAPVAHHAPLHHAPHHAPGPYAPAPSPYAPAHVPSPSPGPGDGPRQHGGGGGHEEAPEIEVEAPEIDAKEILVKVEGCGICAGDIKSYDGAPSFWGVLRPSSVSRCLSGVSRWSSSAGGGWPRGAKGGGWGAAERPTVV